MSFVDKVVEDFVDGVLDQAKDALEGYSSELRYDLEAYLESLLQRTRWAIVTSIFAAAIVSAGAILALLGLTAYLTPLIGTALAWGLVGLFAMALGLLALRTPPWRRAGSARARGRRL